MPTANCRLKSSLQMQDFVVTNVGELLMIHLTLSVYIDINLLAGMLEARKCVHAGTRRR